MKIDPKDYSSLTEISEADLSRCRQEMMTALDVFLKHVRYLMTMMTSMLGAGYAIFTYSITNESVPNELSYGGIAVLMALSPLGHFTHAIAKRYYKIYASNYIYSARLHWVLKRSHPWVNDLCSTQHLDNENLFTDQAVDDFMNAVESDDRHSWYYYKTLITTFRYIGLVSALGLVLCIFLTKNSS